MEKFFHTYFAGGFVGTHEIASVLLEATTGIDIHQEEVAHVLRNSIGPEGLAAGLESLSVSDDPVDRGIVESLSRVPACEDVVSFHRFQLEQWEESIEAAAIANAWQCLDLSSLAPVSPGSDVPYSVNVRDVIGWLNSMGHSPALGQVLQSMLESSRQRTGDDEGGEGVGNKQWGNHDTTKLKQLRAAYEHWWDGVDLSKDVAPTNDQVRDWLIEHHGVSARPAEIMASILRADGLESGPRRKVK